MDDGEFARGIILALIAVVILGAILWSVAPDEGYNTYLITKKYMDEAGVYHIASGENDFTITKEFYDVVVIGNTYGIHYKDKAVVEIILYSGARADEQMYVTT